MTRIIIRIARRWLIGVFRTGERTGLQGGERMVGCRICLTGRSAAIGRHAAGTTQHSDGDLFPARYSATAVRAVDAAPHSGRDLYLAHRPAMAGQTMDTTRHLGVDSSPAHRPNMR